MKRNGVCVAVVGDDDEGPVARVHFVLGPIAAGDGLGGVVGGEGCICAFVLIAAGVYEDIL